MARLKLLLDTNVVIDYLDMRDPHYEKSRLLMLAGYVGEFELWITAPQVTDLIYVLTEGGKKSLVPEVLERLRKLRAFINVFATSGNEVDRMLAEAWDDPEDSLLFEAALSMRADAIITRNQKDFESSLVKVLDCNRFFDWVKESCGIDYGEVAIGQAAEALTM